MDALTRATLQTKCAGWCLADRAEDRLHDHQCDVDDEASYLADKIFMMTNGPGAVLRARGDQLPIGPAARIDVCTRHPYLICGAANRIVDSSVSRSKNQQDVCER